MSKKKMSIKNPRIYYWREDGKSAPVKEHRQKKCLLRPLKAKHPILRWLEGGAHYKRVAT